MSSFGNSNRRMTDAFVAPLPNEGALSYSVAAQCCACMEGVQRWSRSPCLLMSRKRPPPLHQQSVNNSCKDGPAGPLLGVARTTSLVPIWGLRSLGVQIEQLLAGQNSMGKNNWDEKNQEGRGGRFHLEAGGGCLGPPVPPPSLSGRQLASLLWSPSSRAFL